MVTQARSIDVAPTTERDQAVATLTAAFGSDPVVRWVWRDAAQYLTYFGPFVDAFAGGAFANGSAHVAGAFAGVALWLPPGVTSNEEAMGEIAEASIPADEQDEVFAFLGIQAEFHPHEPHWYLPLIGVHPAEQGRGYGAALLEYALATADAEQLLAYLEATSKLNRALYERHGFEEIGVIQYGSSPPMWPMLRKPR